MERYKVYLKVREAFEEAKYLIMRRFLFYYFFLESFRFVYDDEHEMSRKFPVWTDGNVIYVTPLYLSLSKEKRVHGLIHDMLHVLLLHPQRGKVLKEREREEFNTFCFWLAADLKVELIIQDEGFPFRPTWVLNYTISDSLLTKQQARIMSLEEIYYLLKQKIPKKDYQIKMDFIIEGGITRERRKGETQSEGQFILQEGKHFVNGKLDAKEAVQEALRKRALYGKSAGKGRGTLFREIEQTYNIKVMQSWQTFMRDLVWRYAMMFKRSTWRKPNRKLPRDLRGKQKTSEGKVFIFIDVSGSISKEEFEYFVSYAQNLLKYCNGTIVFWDDGVESVYDVKRGEDLKKKIKGTIGGGGTRFTPVVRDFKDKIDNWSLVFVFTDGHLLDRANAIKAIKTQLKGKKILITSDRDVEGFDEIIYI